MKKHRILIVDDFTDNIKLLGQIVEILGYEFTIATNGKQAIEEVKVNDFDLIFMDIEMPVMNGYEATNEIRKLQYPKNIVPIISITAYQSEFISETFKNTCFDGSISKPYTLDKIQEMLNKYII